MWTISLSMVCIIFSYSEDLWSPCVLKNQVVNSVLHWPLCLFLSTWGLGWGGGKGFACDLPYASLLWGLGSLYSASWIDFPSVLDLSKCFWASSSPMTLSQHFCWYWSGVSVYVHSSLLSGGVMLTPWECSEPLTADCLWWFFSVVSGPCWTHHGYQINAGLTKTTVTGHDWAPIKAQGGSVCTRSWRNTEEGAD